jgi:surface antigen
MDGVDSLDGHTASSTPATTTANTIIATGSSIDGDDYKIDSTKYAYGSKQCVDFVLYRLVKHGVLPGITPLGNGRYVVGKLGTLGFKVDTTPAVHSVMSTQFTSNQTLGHTAMVSAVNADGSIVVEEYNFTRTLQYDTRVISASEIKNKQMTFAHTETKYQ